MIRKMLADGPPTPSTRSSREAWGFPVYFGRPSDPLYRLELSETSHPFEQEIDGARIHVPAGAKPSAGSDRVMRVVDQPSGFSYHIQQAKIDAATRTIVAWRSHRLRVDGLGFRGPTSPPTGIGPIRPEELAAGDVNHTIMLSARCLSGHPVPPYAESVTRGDSCGDSDAPTTRLSIGNIVFIDLSDAEIDALPVSTWEKALLRGLADHGALVAFNGDAAWAFQFEGPQSRTALGEQDPYASAGLPETLDYSETLNSVGGWGAHLKVLASFRRPCGDVLCDRPLR
jgi:hypothetical protein